MIVSSWAQGVGSFRDERQRRINCVSPVRGIAPGRGRRFDHSRTEQARVRVRCGGSRRDCASNVFEAMYASIHLESSARTAIELGWMFGVFVVFLVGFLAFRWRRRRKIRICVTSDGLTVNKRRGDVYSFTDVKLGAWGPGSLTVGTALHLHRGPDSLVVGGRDHRLAAGIRLDAAPVGPDAWMSASPYSIPRF